MTNAFCSHFTIPPFGVFLGLKSVVTVGVVFGGGEVWVLPCSSAVWNVPGVTGSQIVSISMILMYGFSN